MNALRRWTLVLAACRAQSPAIVFEKQNHRGHPGKGWILKGTVAAVRTATAALGLLLVIVGLT